MSVVQHRDDYGPRRLQIAVENASGETLTVTHASIVSSHFDGGTAWTRVTEVGAGQTVDLRVLLGDPVCDEVADDTSVRISFVTGDGARGTATVIPADPLGALDTITDLDCFAQSVTDAVTLTLGDHVRVEEREGRPVALLALSAAPSGVSAAPGSPEAGPLTITGVDRTILLRPADLSRSWPLGWTVAQGAGTQTTDLAIFPSNCNPHIVAEDKRGTFFPVEVTLPGGASGTFFLAASATVKGELYSYIADYCRW